MANSGDSGLVDLQIMHLDYLQIWIDFAGSGQSSRREPPKCTSCSILLGKYRAVSAAGSTSASVDPEGRICDPEGGTDIVFVSTLFIHCFFSISLPNSRMIARDFRASKGFSLFVVCIAVFSDVFTYGVIVPVMPFALVQRLGVMEKDVQKWNSVLLGVLGIAIIVGGSMYSLIRYCRRY